ncbi:Zn-ribbon containing protein [Methanocella conradii HZ254]|uniref:Zn-ribbon containing protein n=1 Tax=Methanocella conradii (strain DSM 24694 / JCM 17849 / CGMCC 1.5162 / HZ254) TaxID=1041930 RepID=H8I8F7_METCZ|nr:Zn-ribbon containing protein [Methanocella conradii]AFC99433.1 Zn-ribbon containing protein [Methanocella conradii HZ254]
MPHMCVECKHILESGELDLDRGCPVCGGKKFQYIRPARKDVRKLTVAEYVALAAMEEEQAPEKKETPKAPEKKEAPKAQDRVESVRILEKGRYDINLPVLLSRKELVMSKEEGVYIVDLPSAMKAPKKEKKKKK